MSLTKVRKRAHASFHLGLFTLLSYTVIKVPFFDKNNKNETLKVFRIITATNEIELIANNFRFFPSTFHKTPLVQAREAPQRPSLLQLLETSR